MKQRKALQLASVASMIDQFIIPSIKILIDLGYKVDVVADFTHPGNITEERCNELKHRLYDMGVRVIDVAIPRSLNLKDIKSAYQKISKLVATERYDLIHCHSPIGGVICRQASKTQRKKGTKVVYTAHGFHFYDGAPLRNWMVYYPIEKWYSRYTDVLITINREDYKRATDRFKAGKTVYVPGIGIDTLKFAPRINGRDKIRAELELSSDQIMLLSVGELNNNKNHIAVIKSINNIPNLVYVIVGKGEKKQELYATAKELGVDLRLLGYRSDVADIYNAADLYVLPSIREGLNVSLMEAMASGLAVSCGRIRGNIDLVEDDKCLFDPLNVKEIKTAIEYTINDRVELGVRNLNFIKSFDLSTVVNITTDIYREVF